MIALVAVWSPDVWAQAAADVVEVDSVVSETFNSTQFNKWKKSKKFVSGVEAYDKEEYADALKHFNAEVKAHPANGYAYCNISLCQDKIALDTLYESMTKLFASVDHSTDDIDDPDAFFESVKVKYVEIMTDALSSLDKGISLLPAGDKQSLSQAYLTRATFLDKFLETDSAEVLNSYKKAIEINPNQETYTKLIDYLVNNNETEEANSMAIEAYHVLGEAQCGDDLLAMAGEAFRLKGDHAKAMEIANKVLSNDPTNTQSRETRSSLYNEQKNYSAYVDDIITLSNAGAVTGITSLLLDVIDASDDNWDMVIDKVHQAQDNDDEDAKTNWYLVEGYLNIHHKGDYRTALDCFKKGAEYTYTSSLFTRIAECYYAMGEVDNALQLHCNATNKDPRPEGCSTYYRDNSDWVPESRACARILADTISEITDCKNNGHHVHNNYMSLNWSDTPAVLVEMGYISNPREDRLLASDEYRDLMADAIVEALCRHFGR